MQYAIIPEIYDDGEWFESFDQEAQRWSIWTIESGDPMDFISAWYSEEEAEDALENILS